MGSLDGLMCFFFSCWFGAKRGLMNKDICDKWIFFILFSIMWVFVTHNIYVINLCVVVDEKEIRRIQSATHAYRKILILNWCKGARAFCRNAFCCVRRYAMLLKRARILQQLIETVILLCPRQARIYTHFICVHVICKKLALARAWCITNLT